MIPEGITRIMDGTFYGCSELVSIEIPESVTYIGDYAFFGCTKLSIIKCARTRFKIVKVGRDVFTGCDNIEHMGITLPPRRNKAKRI